ncbi:MAG: diaminopimelate decarboxylase [Coleofasciculus sp. C3-bin4]|nr:diaminopimelate decarboxylase [Coleofasciculus sp. C3-bin4]
MKHLTRDTRHSIEAARWWERSDLCYKEGNLCFAGRQVLDLVKWANKPVFLYSPRRAIENLKRVDAALHNTGCEHQIYYALKANRFAPLLTTLAQSGLCGVDICSPREGEAALSAGFLAHQISYTGTSLSDSDIDFVLKHPTLTINCDSLSVLRRVGERAAGRAIGLRLNPGIGVGHNPLLEYSGSTDTKFGIYKEQWPDALSLIEKHSLRVTGLHFHVGCGYSNRHLGAWEAALNVVLGFARILPTVQVLNLGGGFGVPHTAQDEVLDLQLWSRLLKRNLSGSGYTLAVEPGDYIVKDAGILVLTVNSVEVKGQTHFVSVDGGFNLHPEPVFYNLPCEPVPCTLREADEQFPVTVAGNINEALDTWARNLNLPIPLEGDRLAFINAGGYGAAMSSNHCMRGDFHEQLVLS